MSSSAISTSAASPSIVGSLIRKDLYLMRGAMIGAIAAGAFGLALMPISRMMSYFSAVILICVLIVHNIFLVMYGVAQERKDKTLLFILSLPVSTMEYTVAKVMAAGIAFGVPWLVLTVATAIMIIVSPIPDGALPYWITLLAYLLAYFCGLLGIALLKDSTGWHGAAITIGNVSVNFLVPLLLSRPSVTKHIDGPVVVWGGDLVAILAVELLAGFAVLGYGIYAHAHRSDFV